MALGIGEPSVAQPPLPLQLFLPLQPLSLDLQPPWPLQSFLPLQECLGGLSALVSRSPAFAALTVAPLEPLVAAWAATEVPPISPESAAVRSNAFSLLLVIEIDLAWG